EDGPDRPHEVDVAHLLARLWLGEPELAAPEVVDLLSATHKDMSKRKLLAVIGLGAIVAIEGVARRGQQKGMLPPPFASVLAELVDGRLCDHRETYPLRDMA